jgi:MinD-like ATPase involved in chromosome partitioning or flagellar assembly
MDRKSGITPEAVEENLNYSVNGIIPFDERAVSTSVNRGVPLMLSDRGSSIAKSIIEILGTLKEKLLEMEKVIEE